VVAVVAVVMIEVAEVVEVEMDSGRVSGGGG
jgi:hypothetical protein